MELKLFYEYLQLVGYILRYFQHCRLKDKRLRPIIQISHLSKNYPNGLSALNNINLEINKGEIFALLGPNGAGKTTLISIICGITNASSGSILVGGYDTITQFRKARQQIGLVPQELTLSAFETVWHNVCFSCGLFGKKVDKDYIESLLKKLSLWEKKDSTLMSLSGGMKRRVLIAKALSHQPDILFLDEPTAGVDVELRRDMWEQVSKLKESGVTIILTTHYLEEAEEIADRVAIIDKGQITLVEETSTLMNNLGKKQIILHLCSPLAKIPDALKEFHLDLDHDQLIAHYDPKKNEFLIPKLIETLQTQNIPFYDISTKQSTLEEIFVNLVKL